MAFMDWALEVAGSHPELEGAFIDVDGQWLDVLLPDGRTFRFRPEQMIDASKPEPVRRQLLVRLISIGVAGAQAAPSPAQAAPSPAQATDGVVAPDVVPSPEGDEAPDTADWPEPAEDPAREHLMPIVRSADYFVKSHDHSRDDSLIYVPMTPFIGTGIAVDGPETITPLYFSDIERLGLPGDIVPIFQNALTRLRTSDMAAGQPTVQVQPLEVGGATVYEFIGPASYQSSWFMDVEMALTVGESLGKAKDDSLPLFVPASRTSMFIVMVDDPGLPNLFKHLAEYTQRTDGIYPLPHVVSQDGWSEWIPMPDHPAARILAKLRTSARERIYRAQAEAMRKWPGDFGTLVDFETIRNRAQVVSCARWTSRDGYGSLPETDYVAFVRMGSGQPWDEDRGEIVLLRSQVARDVWHEGIEPMRNVWPPRWAVRGFPDEAQLNALREAAGREF